MIVQQLSNDVTSSCALGDTRRQVSAGKFVFLPLLRMYVPLLPYFYPTPVLSLSASSLEFVTVTSFKNLRRLMASRPRTSVIKHSFRKGRRTETSKAHEPQFLTGHKYVWLPSSMANPMPTTLSGVGNGHLLSTSLQDQGAVKLHKIPMNGLESELFTSGNVDVHQLRQGAACRGSARSPLRS